jgi:hypothetical protein
METLRMETWRHGDMETWRHGDMETWRHGDMKTWRHENRSHGDMETWKHGIETGTWRHGISKRKGKRKSRRFSLSFIISTQCSQKFVVCPFIDEETNGSYPFANGLNRLYGLAHLC